MPVSPSPSPPPPPRDLGRLLARLVCAVFGLLGVMPFALGALLTSAPLERWAARETARILREQLGVQARYAVRLHLFPLSAALENLVIPATDGGSPALRATRVSVTPRIFSLLAGRLDLGDVAIDQPELRLVVRDGKLENVAYRLPEAPKKARARSKLAPFASLSVNDARLTLDLDGARIHTDSVDVDAFTEIGPSFEVALHSSRAQLTRRRPPGKGSNNSAEPAVDEDVLCLLELRLRYEAPDLLVRRLSALGAFDLDAATGTRPSCTPANADSVNQALLRLSQLRLRLGGEARLVDGHVVARAPLGVVNRFVHTSPLRGFAAFAGDVHYDGRHKLPEIRGKLSGGGIQFERYKLAQKLDVDLEVNADQVIVPRYEMLFADGDVVMTNARIEPFAPGVPISAQRVDGSGMQFEGLMRDLGVTPDTIVKWDLATTRVSKIVGTLAPLKIDADLYAETRGFEVFDRSFRSPGRKHMIGVKNALVRGRLGVRPDSFDIYDTRADFGSSSLLAKLVSIGFSNQIELSVAKGSRLDLADISPLVDIPMAGKAELDVEMAGLAKDPLLTGNLRVQGFEFGGFPFGDVKSSKVRFRPLVLDLADVEAQKGKSNYNVAQARIDFNTGGTLVADAKVKSASMDLRDFLAIWHFDLDPRFDDLAGQTALEANVHYALGGREDRCGGGTLRTSGALRASSLDLFEEHYDGADAQFDFRWTDRDASYQGIDLTVPSLTLHKGSGVLVGAIGMRQGGRVYGHLVGTSVPLSALDSLPAALRSADGRVSATAEISGSVDELAVSASGNIGPVRVGRALLPASQFRVELVPEPSTPKVVGKSRCGAPITAAFDRNDFEADHSQGTFHVDGQLFGGQLSFSDLRVTRQRNKVVSGNVDFDDLEIGALAELSAGSADSAAPPAGHVSGRLGLSEFRVKDPLRSRATLALAALDVTQKGYRVELLPGAGPVVFERGRASLSGMAVRLTTPRGQSMTFDASGSVDRLGGSPELDTRFTLRPVPLDSLVGVIPRAERAEGSLSGHLEVSGPLLAPRYSGGFEVDHGGLSFRGLPTPISDIDLALRIEGNELSIARGSARMGSGTLAFSGSAPLDGFELGSARLAVTARELTLPLSEGIHAVADADLTASWQPSQEGAERSLPRVVGDVTLRSLEYRRPVTMTADISSLAQRGRRTEFEVYDPSDDVLDFDLRVRALRSMKIQNNLIDAELQIGDEGLTLAGSNARFGLRGAVTLRPGGKIFLRRSEFEVTQGRVRFDDLTRVAPVVDVTAVTEYRRYASSATSSQSTSSTATTASSPTAQAGRWRIQLHAHGDADNLRVDLTSDPQLAQDDIFLLLTVGLTRAELDQAQSASVGESVALEALGSITGADRAVTEAVPLIDEFRLGSAYSSITGRTEPTVTIGKRLTRRVRANVTSGVADTREVRSNLEWQLSPRVSVEGSYDNVNDISSSSLGNLGADVRWRLEFE